MGALERKKDEESPRNSVVENVRQLVLRHSLSDLGRNIIDISSRVRGAAGTRGYGINMYGNEVGWWVHPERYAKEMAWLFDALELRGDENIISIGCGPAFHEIALAEQFPDLDILATDIDVREIKTGRAVADERKVRNVGFYAMNAEQGKHLPFEIQKRRFKRAVSMAALHDVPDLDAAFAGLVGFLHHDARFVLTHNPDRRARELPDAEPLTLALARYFTIIDEQPLITADDALNYYGKIEENSQKTRGYGLRQDAVIAVPR